MTIVSVTEAKAQFSRLLERVAAGEDIVITRSGKPVARLVPCAQPKPARRKPGSLKGKIWISPDFGKQDKEIEALFYDSPIEPPER